MILVLGQKNRKNSLPVLNERTVKYLILIVNYHNIFQFCRYVVGIIKTDNQSSIDAGRPVETVGNNKSGHSISAGRNSVVVFFTSGYDEDQENDDVKNLSTHE